MPIGLVHWAAVNDAVTATHVISLLDFAGAQPAPRAGGDRA